METIQEGFQRDATRAVILVRSPGSITRDIRALAAPEGGVDLTNRRCLGRNPT